MGHISTSCNMFHDHYNPPYASIVMLAIAFILDCLTGGDHGLI